MNRKFRIFILLAILLLIAQIGHAFAYTIEYDSGVLGVSYSSSWGKYFANRFTNESDLPVSITRVLIRKPPMAGSSIDVYLWQDVSGIPGDMIGGPVSGYLSSDWGSVDVSHLQVILGSGDSIFVGFDPIGDAQVPYDDSSPGVGRSWWDKDGTGDWTLGGPHDTTRNLMVRIEVTEIDVSKLTVNYGDIIDNGWYWPGGEVWDLTQCDLIITYTLDMSDYVPPMWNTAWSSIGVGQGAWGWMASGAPAAAETDDNNQDIDDKLNLGAPPDRWDEASYDATGPLKGSITGLLIN